MIKQLALIFILSVSQQLYASPKGKVEEAFKLLVTAPYGLNLVSQKEVKAEFVILEESELEIFYENGKTYLTKKAIESHSIKWLACKLAHEFTHEWFDKHSEDQPKDLTSYVAYKVSEEVHACLSEWFVVRDLQLKRNDKPEFISYLKGGDPESIRKQIMEMILCRHQSYKIWACNGQSYMSYYTKQWKETKGKLKNDYKNRTK